MSSRNRPTCWAALWLVPLLLVAAGSPAMAQARLPRVMTLELALPGTEEQDVRWPVAVATAATEDGAEIAVGDAFGPKLILFRGSGLTWQLESAVELPGMPIGLVHDGDRFIASIRGERSLIAFEGPELLQRRIGLPREVVPGPLAALPDGGLLVYDYAEERVLELDPRGALERQVKIDGLVTDLAATASGGFFATVGQTGTVWLFTADGELETKWRLPDVEPVPAWPASVVADPLGGVVVVDRHGDRLLVLDTAGKAIGVGSRRGFEPGLIRFPSAIGNLPDGRLVVADQGNGRVQIFRRSDRESTQ